MKKLNLLSLLILFTGCTVVYFDRPQPENGKELKTVPVELMGKWIDGSDTVYITKNGQIKINVYTDSLNKVTVTKNNTFLSDSLRLKKTGKYYVINVEDEKGWGIANIVIKERNGDLLWYSPNRFPFFKERCRLKTDKVIITKSGQNEPEEYESLKNLKIDDSTEFEEIHYKGQLKNRDIKKIILPQNLETVYKSDGRIIHPKSDTIPLNKEIPNKN